MPLHTQRPHHVNFVSYDNALFYGGSIANNVQRELIKLEVNLRPIVSIAASNNEVKEGESISIEVTATDPDNDELTYQWLQTAGSVSLAMSTTSTLSLIAPQVASDEIYTFEVTVSDGRDTITESISIKVLDQIAEETSSPIKQSGGTLFWLLLILAFNTLYKPKFNSL